MIPGFVPPGDPNQEAARESRAEHDERAYESPFTTPTHLRALAGEVLASLGIIGTEDLSGDEIIDELRRGGRFVVYQYCVSLIFLTVLQPTKIHFLKAGQSAAYYGSTYSIMSMFTGWWGLPWGPIRTFQALSNNANGIDVTAEVLASVGVYGGVPSEPSHPTRKSRARSRFKKSPPRGGEDYGIQD